MVAKKTCLPLKMPTSKCCNSGTNNDIELKVGEFSYLMDMFMCTKHEQILRWWIIWLYCFEMEWPIPVPWGGHMLPSLALHLIHLEDHSPLFEKCWYRAEGRELRLTFWFWICSITWKGWRNFFKHYISGRAQALQFRVNFYEMWRYIEICLKAYLLLNYSNTSIKNTVLLMKVYRSILYTWN